LTDPLFGVCALSLRRIAYLLRNFEISVAAALMLGAAGVNLGTRFIASKEAPADDEWKQAIATAASEGAIKVEVLNDISPPCRAQPAMARSYAHSTQSSWMSGQQNARKRAGIVIV